MLPRLKTRAAFLAGNASRRRCATDGLVLQVITRAEISANSESQSDVLPPIRLGFTATKKLGGAVVRNRVKRRLRALADKLMPIHARPGFDYVLIGRLETEKRVFAKLEADLLTALARTGMKISPDSLP